MKHQVVKNQGLKKIRGKKRKVTALCKRIRNNTKDYPLIELSNRGYFDYKLPAYRYFIDCCNGPTDIRKQVSQTLIDATEYLINSKPAELQHTKVVLLLTLPNLFYASINVFFDQDYYNGFFKRNSNYQTWSDIDLAGSQASRYSLEMPQNLQSKLILETINDDDYSGTSEIYMIGEIPD